MAAVLLAGGAKGKRMALPNAKILLHQLSGGFEGQATDIEIQAREVISVKRRLEEIVATPRGARPAAPPSRPPTPEPATAQDARHPPPELPAREPDATPPDPSRRAGKMLGPAYARA